MGGRSVMALIVVGTFGAVTEAAGASGGGGDAGSWLGPAMILAAPVALVALWAADVIRPGSMRRRAARDAGAVSAWMWLGAALAVLLAMSAGGGLALSAMQAAGTDLDSTKARAVAALAQWAAGGVVGIVLVRSLARGAPQAGLADRWASVPKGLLGLGATLPVCTAVAWGAAQVQTLVSGRSPDPIAHDTLRAILENPGDPHIALLIVGVVLGAPLCEELMYRLFVQSAVLRLTGGRWPAILITATLFAIVHRAGEHPVPWHALAPLWVLGIALGTAYERTGRPGVPILMHAGFNAANVVLAVLLT